MHILNWLKSAGGRIGLVSFVSTTAPAPPEKIPTRKVTLRELMSEVQHDEVKALADLPSELSASYEKVFDAAGVAAPPHGWTIERLQQQLRDARYATLDRQSVQKEILQTLSANQAHVQDVVKDAVARDQALDAFELFVVAKMNTRADMRKEKSAQLQDRIKELQKELAQLDAEAKSDHASLSQWQAKKVEFEKSMADALSFLLEKPVISIGNNSAKPQA
jgi:hypothetical protein